MQFSILLLVCAGFTTCLASPLTNSASQVLLPKPTGLYQVGRSTAELIDNSRNQPLAPDIEPVRLEISVFYPVVHQHHSIPGPYFPPETALFEDNYLSSQGLASPNGTFERLALQLASNEPFHNSTGQNSCEYPLVIFMPGEGTTRLFYSQIASTIASKGFIVVTIDAPYDVDVVQYPDGTFAFINPIWFSTDNATLLATAYTAIETRMADVSFVLDSLSNSTLAASLIPNLPPSGLNTSHSAMFGHSLGGSTAYSIIGSDERILGGLNMDGLLFGPGLPKGTSSKPFMLMGHATHFRSNQTDDPWSTWEEGWSNLTTGWKRDIVISDTLHYDFSDYPIVFETLGINPCNQTVRDTTLLIGPMGGKRILEIVTTYVGAFLDFVLYGKCSALLDGPVDKYPEVVFDH